jgi:cytochrome c oxidase subunit 2
MGLRCRIARLLAIGTNVMLLAMAFLFAARQNRPRPVLAAAAANAAVGRLVYDRERCAMCHSIGGVGGRVAALDGVGSRLGPDELRKWIVAPQEMKPGVRKRAYELSEADLEALVAYLGTLVTRGDSDR